MEVDSVGAEEAEVAIGNLGGALEDIANELREGNVVMEGPQELARIAVCRRHGGNLGAILTDLGHTRAGHRRGCRAWRGAERLVTGKTG